MGWEIMQPRGFHLLRIQQEERKSGGLRGLVCIAVQVSTQAGPHPRRSAASAAATYAAELVRKMAQIAGS